MSTKRGLVSVVVALACSAVGLQGQQNSKDLAVVHQIKVEAFQNSKVMDTLGNLSDVYGPRLTASPEWEQAAQWAMTELKSYGLANVHEEKWGPFGRSWSIESYDLNMLTPRYSHLVTVPLAWSSPTNGVITGEVFFAPFGQERTYDPKKIRAALDDYKAKWHGKLKGKIILLTNAKQPKPSTNPLFDRYTDAQLAEIAKAPTPSVQRNITVDQLEFPSDMDQMFKYLGTLPQSVILEFFDVYENLMAEVGVFLKEEGVAGVISSDTRSHNGALHAESAGSVSAKKPMAPPTFVVTEEQYSRMQRLVEKKQPVTVNMDLKAKFSNTDVDGADIIAEIPGQKSPMKW